MRPIEVQAFDHERLTLPITREVVLIIDVIRRADQVRTYDMAHAVQLVGGEAIGIDSSGAPCSGQARYTAVPKPVRCVSAGD